MACGETASKLGLEKVADGRLEFVPDRDVDEEIAARIDDEQPVVERREAKEPHGRSEV